MGRAVTMGCGNCKAQSVVDPGGCATAGNAYNPGVTPPASDVEDNQEVDKEQKKKKKKKKKKEGEEAQEAVTEGAPSASPEEAPSALQGETGTMPPNVER